MAAKRTVVIGLLGTSLDRGNGPGRWSEWRPGVSACQYEELLAHRFELLHDSKHAPLAKTVAADIESVSPETDVPLNLVEFANPWDFEEVYGKLAESRRIPAQLLQTSPPKRDGLGEFSIIDLDLSRYDRLAIRHQ